MLEILLKVLDSQGVYGYVIVIVITGGLFLAVMIAKWFLRSLDKRDETQVQMSREFSNTIALQVSSHAKSQREFLETIKEHFKTFHEKNYDLHEGTRELIKKKFNELDLK